MCCEMHPSNTIAIMYCEIHPSNTICRFDLVQCQTHWDERHPPLESGLKQDHVWLLGNAIQCHMTTEDPAEGFQPVSTVNNPGKFKCIHCLFCQNVLIVFSKFQIFKRNIL